MNAFISEFTVLNFINSMLDNSPLIKDIGYIVPSNRFDVIFSFDQPSEATGKNEYDNISRLRYQISKNICMYMFVLCQECAKIYSVV